jgi:hypothetical protein
MSECREVKPLLTLYAYDDLSDDERETVERHLRGCPECAFELEEIEQAVSLLQRATSIEMELISNRVDDLEVKVYRRLAWQAVSGDEMEKDKRSRWRPLWRPWVQAASAAAALLLGIYIGASYIPTPRPIQPQHQIVQMSDSDECIRRRLERFADENALKRLENARVINYVRGDAWSAWGEYQQIIHENPDSYLATVAMEELMRTGYEP